MEINMNSNLLNSIGLGNLDIGIVLIVFLVIAIAALVISIINSKKISEQNRRLALFMKGKAAKSLENEIVRMFDENSQMTEDIEKIKADVDNIFDTLETTFQKMGLVKYDAFNQMGGKLSFCLALLDQNNNGFLINSMHSTENCYSYVKRIELGMCKSELSGEEALALRRAMGKDTDEAD